MTDNLKIIHINTEKTFRGGELQTLLIMEELKNRGHEGILIARPDSGISAKAREFGFAPVNISMKGEWDLLSALRIGKQIRKYKPDVVHAHTPHAGALALMARLWNKKPKVVISRRVGFSIRKNFFSRKKWLGADAIHAVSNAVKNRLIRDGVPKEKIFVAESAFGVHRLQNLKTREEIREKLGIPQDAFVVGNVAHFDRHKGQRELMEVFAKFAGHFYDKTTYLLLVGDGPELRHCKNFAYHHNLSDRVIFAGRRDNVGDFYKAMDVFFLSTVTDEGWSNAVSEAQFLEIPVIATDMPVMKERIDNRKDGILVPVKWREEWLNALILLYENPDLRKNIAQAGRERVSKYNVQNLAEKLLKCYRAIL